MLHTISLTNMEEDGPENPLSSLQYHTLMVLGTEDYAATRTLRGLQRHPQGTWNDGQMQGEEGKQMDQQGNRLALQNTPHVDGVKQALNFSNSNVPDALRQRECPGGSDSKEAGTPPSEALTQGTDISKKPLGGPSNAPVSLEYCSSPVPRLTDPAYDHVRGPAAPSPCPTGGVDLLGPVTPASSLTCSSSSSLLPSLTPQSSLGSGSHLEFSSPASWSSMGSSRTPCVSSMSSTESMRPCGRDLPPHCLYSHDRVPMPVPVAGAAPGSRAARPRRVLRSAECASSSSEKTLVGSRHDSARMMGSGGTSGSLLPDTTDSTPVYENPSELDSEYYYKSPKGKAASGAASAGWPERPVHRAAGPWRRQEDIIM